MKIKVFTPVAFILVLLMTVSLVRAQHVSRYEATHAAGVFFANHHKGSPACVKIFTQGQDTLYYIFNSDNSYVVIAADRRVPPVLAFSDQDSYQEDAVSPAAQMWFDHYARQLSELKQQPAASTPENPEWERLTQRQPVLRTLDAVAPLMQSHWGQSNNYNYACPTDYAGPGNHVVTGCVATAISQLIYYYRFPESGVGTYSYTDSTYGQQSVDYESAHYDFSAMCDEPTTVNTAISQLMYHSGVGMDMHYGTEGSGVYNHSAARVLREHFKFSPETQYVFRDSTNLDWDSLILVHLNRNMPVYYAGWSVPNVDGHGFICDGYQLMDSNYYYHFNFGWDGFRDGYFYTDALVVSGTHFNLAQELVINAYPDTLNYPYPADPPATGTQTLTTPAGSFPDGVTPWHTYSFPTDYTWIIRPDAENMTKIALKLEYSLSEGDSLIVTSNGQNNEQILSADTGNVQLRWTCTEMTVRLLTTSGNARLHASYQIVQPLFCEEENYTSATSGTITDGSGTANYNPLTTCKFKIVVPGAQAVAAHFSYFDLEENHDFLHVYHQTASEENWIASYTGTMPDTTIVFQHNRLYFIFESDEFGNADGFSFDYERTTGIEESQFIPLSVYPNPAISVLNVESDRIIDEVVLRDVTGRELLRPACGNLRCSFPVSAIPAGLYFLQVVCDGQQITRKVVIK